MKSLAEVSAEAADEEKAIRVTPIYILQRLQTLAQMEAQRRVLELQRDIAMHSRRLEPYGFKVFSQGDQDGILQEIFRRIDVTNRTFFEFGCGNGLESNCAYLLIQGWRGAWVDADRRYVDEVARQFADQAASGQLQVAVGKATAENIDRLIKTLELPAELDLLSIDIDGNDYHVWRALSVLRPRVVVIEYNAAFPPPVKLVQKYQPNLEWTGTNYFGASLQALVELGREKGYTLVGTDLIGANAFFVRDDCVLDRVLGEDGQLFPVPDPAVLYNPPRFHLIEYGWPGHPPGMGPYEVLP